MSILNRFRRNSMRKKLEDRVVGWGMTPDEVRVFFKSLNMRVLTFFGYSGLGYENDARMLEIAREVLLDFSPEDTIVNIGVTAMGLGQVYPLAKEMGFRTTGIVSTQALDFLTDVSEHVDQICFVNDEQWGGFIPGTTDLSPTSEAMVTVSDICIAIGGNEVSRDELLAARKLGKPVRFIPAEMNHQKSIQRTSTRGLPKPTSFDGEAHEVFANEKDDDPPHQA